MYTGTEYFFVYGTLKVDGRFSYLLDKYRIQSTDAEITGFTLLDFGEFPGIIKGKGNIKGELHQYKNPEIVKNIMDRIEGYDSERDDGLYIRRKTMVDCKTHKIEASTYIYNHKVPKNTKVIVNGIWKKGLV